MEFALTLCQIQVTISKSAQEKMRLRHKEMESFQGPKEPEQERERELMSQSLGTRRTLMKEGTGYSRHDSLRLGDFLANTLAKREAARAPHSPPPETGQGATPALSQPSLGPISKGEHWGQGTGRTSSILGLCLPPQVSFPSGAGGPCLCPRGQAAHAEAMSVSS